MTSRCHDFMTTLIPPSLVNLVVLKLEVPMLTKADEIGEICISSIGCGSGYFGLIGKSEQAFKVIPLDKEGRPVGNHTYVKTGLLGFW